MASQRDVMRVLFRRHMGNESAVIRAYADAERRGEVSRKSNDYAIDAEEYARRLLADAKKKGWISEYR
ncbi:MAG: hypothetical protein JWO05_3847 [Gemmatimonadetes bacterium]|nr:hypothetical protein [Gemmatimonadota bacterium]